MHLFLRNRLLLPLSAGDQGQDAAGDRRLLLGPHQVAEEVQTAGSRRPAVEQQLQTPTADGGEEQAAAVKKKTRVVVGRAGSTAVISKRAPSSVSVPYEETRSIFSSLLRKRKVIFFPFCLICPHDAVHFIKQTATTSLILLVNFPSCWSILDSTSKFIVLSSYSIIYALDF